MDSLAEAESKSPKRTMERACSRRGPKPLLNPFFSQLLRFALTPRFLTWPWMAGISIEVDAAEASEGLALISEGIASWIRAGLSGPSHTWISTASMCRLGPDAAEIV